MAVKFVVEFHGAKQTPFVSGAKGRSLKQFINYCVALLSGHFSPAGASVKVRNAAVAASGTVTFSGAATASDTVTVNGQALTATKKNASSTATFSTIVAGNTVTLNGVTFTARASPTLATEFALGADDTAAATNLAAAVNAYNVYPLPARLVTATSAGAVVTFRAVTPGTAGNAITLTKVGSPITVTGSGFLAGGAAAGNNAFDPGNTAATAGQALTDAINASTTAKVSLMVATHNGSGVVTVTAPPGVMGNLGTLAKSGSNIAVSGANLTGGSEDAAFSFSF